jgi:hypothetical protein
MMKEGMLVCALEYYYYRHSSQVLTRHQPRPYFSSLPVTHRYSSLLAVTYRYSSQVLTGCKRDDPRVMGASVASLGIDLLVRYLPLVRLWRALQQQRAEAEGSGVERGGGGGGSGGRRRQPRQVMMSNEK